MRRKALAAVLAVAALSITAAPALGDPDFGRQQQQGTERWRGQVSSARPDGERAGLQVGRTDLATGC